MDSEGKKLLAELRNQLSTNLQDNNTQAEMESVLLAFDIAQRTDSSSFGELPNGRQWSRADIYRAYGAYDKALAEWCKEIETARENSDTQEEAYLLIMAGSYYFKVGREQVGVEHLWHGLHLAQQTGNRRLEAQANIELGYVAYKYDRPDKALECFQKVLHIGREISDQHYEHIGLGNVGGIIAKGGHLQEGIDMINQARRIAHEVSETLDEAAHCHNLGILLLHNLRPREGLEALERAQQIYREEGISSDRTVDELVRRTREILDSG
jgi:tetratricopeptide (TPR) repeat protein